jgi:malate dehydrogenase
VGGHSGVTIVPLFSHLPERITDESQLAAMIEQVQQAGTRVVEAKAGAGSATLAMAYAALRFSLSLVRACQGESNVLEYAFVEGGNPMARFFSQPVRLGKEGVVEVLDYQPVHPFEQAAIEQMLPVLNKEIQQGIDYALHVLRD